jgi:hypothetical protein
MAIVTVEVSAITPSSFPHRRFPSSSFVFFVVNSSFCV